MTHALLTYIKSPRYVRRVLLFMHNSERENNRVDCRLGYLYIIYWINPRVWNYMTSSSLTNGDKSTTFMKAVSVQWENTTLRDSNSIIHGKTITGKSKWLSKCSRNGLSFTRIIMVSVEEKKVSIHCIVLYCYVIVCTTRDGSIIW